MLRRVTFTVMKDSDCEHSVTIGRSEGSGSYCYADEAEAEIARWKAEALAARALIAPPGLELMWDASDLVGWTRKRAMYAAARAANGEE